MKHVLSCSIVGRLWGYEFKPPHPTEWMRPDLPSRCTFSLDTPISSSPHKHFTRSLKPKIAEDVLDLIGNTPLVKLKHIAKTEGIEAEIIAKCEFLNIAGSMKDRIAKRLIMDAEISGQLKPGDTIIEPTSGNTGIGLALVAAVKGYRCIIVMPETISKEKEYLLRNLGAEVIRTPSHVHYTDPKSHIRTAWRIKQEIGSRAHILNQYVNSSNPLVHFDETAEEIIQDCTDQKENFKLDMIVMGTGTGGSLTGIGRKLKIKNNNCKIVAVNPVGFSLANKQTQKSSHYEVEGIGGEFAPTVLDQGIVDYWYEVSDKDSFLMSRRIVREEGLLCGGSSGACLVAAIRAIKELGYDKNKRILVLMPDTMRNYLTKFLSDGWMYSRGYLDFPQSKPIIAKWSSFEVGDFLDSVQPTCRIDSHLTIKEAVACLKSENVNMALVIDPSHERPFLGLFNSDTLQSLISGQVMATDPVTKAMNKNIREVDATNGIEAVARELMAEEIIVVRYKQNPKVVSRIDFLKWSLSKD